LMRGAVPTGRHPQHDLGAGVAAAEYPAPHFRASTAEALAVPSGAASRVEPRPLRTFLALTA
jgi:hypothetical protein